MLTDGLGPKLYINLKQQNTKGLPMSGDRTAKEERAWSKKVKQLTFATQINEWNSNIYNLLVSGCEETRFLKLLSREDGTWLAMAGAWDEAGAPIVAFGNGETPLMALRSLGRSVAGNHWKEDNYEPPKS